MAGELAAPEGPDGEGRTTDVTVIGEVPPGVVVRYVVSWTADVGVVLEEL